MTFIATIIGTVLGLVTSVFLMIATRSLGHSSRMLGAVVLIVAATFAGGFIGHCARRQKILLLCMVVGMSLGVYGTYSCLATSYEKVETVRGFLEEHSRTQIERVTP